MTLDLERALRDAVDGAPDDPRALGGTAGLAALHARVRRRPTARAVARTTVGAGAACVVGLGALAAQRGGTGDPPAAAGPGGPAGTSAPAAAPVEPSDSDLCGAAVAGLAVTSGGVDLSLGLPGVDVDGGELVGRSLGGEVPVWLDVPADAGAEAPTEELVGSSILLVRDEVVVAVADGAAVVVSSDDTTAGMLTEAQRETAGTGTLRACPGTGSEGLAGAVPAAGEYTLRAVARLERAEDGAAHLAVSPPVPVTLLPEEAPIAAGAENLPADFPLDAVPLVGTRVIDAVTAGTGGWKVTVEVHGTDALQRAADALGVPQGSTGSWVRFSGVDAELTLVQEEAVAAAERVAGTRAVGSADRWVRTDLTEWGGTADGISARGRGVGIDVQELPGEDGGTTLVYRVTRG
jgi:hypothetical protein